MTAALRSFIARYCAEHPAAAYPVKAFVTAFRESLPASEQRSCTRSFVLQELVRSGYPVGIVSKVQVIGGLAPRGEWTEADGRLTLRGSYAS